MHRSVSNFVLLVHSGSSPDWHSVVASLLGGSVPATGPAVIQHSALSTGPVFSLLIVAGGLCIQLNKCAPGASCCKLHSVFAACMLCHSFYSND